MNEKPIRFTAHALDRMRFRGATEDEVIKAIRSFSWQHADLGRWECRINIPFNSIWNGKSYTTKLVRPIFADEADNIVVVTVYTYYSKE